MNNDELKFIEKTHKITDKFGNVKTIKSKQTTIGKYIWRDSDIKYYDALCKLIEKAKQMEVSDMVEELIEEVECNSVGKE